MGKKRIRLASNSFLRKTGMVLLLVLAADLAVELICAHFFGDFAAMEYGGEEVPISLTSRGLEYIGLIPFLDERIAAIKIGLVGLSFLVITAWAFQAMRNLRAMDIHSHLEPGWLVASWIIAPLLLFTFPMSVRDLIAKYSRIYDLLGRKKGDKMPPKGKFQRMFTLWWYTFWGGHLLLFVDARGMVGKFPGFLFDSMAVEKASYFILTSVLVLAPLLMGARFLYRFGKLEDAVLKIGDEGVLEDWRAQKLQSGQIHADLDGLPDWYAQPGKLQLDLPESAVFRDQPPRGKNQ